MMYDGEEYQNRSNVTKPGKSSTGSRLQGYQRQETWETEVPRIVAGLTGDAKQYWLDFLDRVREERRGSKSPKYKSKQ